MKKSLTIIFTTLSLLLILDSMHFGDALMMFLLAGVIPGTNSSLDGAQMLELCLLISGFVFARIMMHFVRLTKHEIIKNPRSSRLHA